MPFKSKKQQAWAHTTAGEKALGGPQKVAEWDKATNQSTLPSSIGKKTTYPNLPTHIHRITTK